MHQQLSMWFNCMFCHVCHVASMIDITGCWIVHTSGVSMTSLVVDTLLLCLTA